MKKLFNFARFLQKDPKMKTKMLIKNQKGAALVEFAIVVPLLILLATGIGEFGLVLYNKQVITNASREGARAGIVQWKHPPPPPRWDSLHRRSSADSYRRYSPKLLQCTTCYLWFQ